VKAVCGSCESGVYWNWEGESSDRPPVKWVCRKCESKNFLRRPPRWPNVPPFVYIGHERNRQMKVYPIPPEENDVTWCPPYSTRSFMAQASRRLGGCAFSTRLTGTVMGQPVFSDRCMEAGGAADEYAEDHECHVLAGFATGQTTCALLDELNKLCQTEIERRFLRWYLELAKDRQFPMLIPQPRIGIAERRRPDFVVFVPVHYWSYKQYAVQLDAAHDASIAAEDRLRDEEVAVQGYTVVSLRPSRAGYNAEVKRLLEQIERDMAEVEADPWSVAVEVEVYRTEPAKTAPPF
jgi:hypothetical protein